jgi:hypothetical protein
MDTCAVDLCLVTDFFSGTVFSMLGMTFSLSSGPYKCSQKKLVASSRRVLFA